MAIPVFLGMVLVFSGCGRQYTASDLVGEYHDPDNTKGIDPRLVFRSDGICEWKKVDLIKSRVIFEESYWVEDNWVHFKCLRVEGLPVLIQDEDRFPAHIESVTEKGLRLRYRGSDRSSFYRRVGQVDEQLSREYAAYNRSKQIQSEATEIYRQAMAERHKNNFDEAIEILRQLRNKKYAETSTFKNLDRLIANIKEAKRRHALVGGESPHEQIEKMRRMHEELRKELKEREEQSPDH